MILFISDFDMKASGYAQISIALCNQLATRFKKKVIALGISYDGSEHNWPFSIIPINQMEYLQHIPAMIHNLRGLAENKVHDEIEAIVVAMDIPLHEKFLQIDRGSIPYIGIFPIESGPLCTSWATSLSLMTERLVISKFGLHMMEEAGVDGNYMPVGLDTESWRLPELEERKALRESLGFDDNDFVVLTVADNQERKNLSIAAQIIAKAREKINAKWLLVTRVYSPVGWKLDDLATSLGITDAFMKFDRGLPFNRLWVLFAAADAFLLTSKAEGLCMPLVEAMAAGLPVVATNCTAVPEHLYSEPDWNRVYLGQWGKGKPRGQRGYPIPVEFATIDPWGNSIRSFADPREGAKILVKLAKKKPLDFIAAAREYAESRTWDTAGNVLNRVIREGVARVIEEMVAPDAPEAMASLPASMPRPIPVMGPESLQSTGGVAPAEGAQNE